MMKHYLLILFCFPLLAASCQDEGIELEVPDLPSSRAFHMGFTGFPYALSEHALAKTFEHVLADGDLLLVHLDHGVPWEEALNGEPLPREVLNSILPIQNLSTHKILLTTTATSQERNELARYWNDAGEHQDLPAKWANKSFDDREVITAYLNYCQQLITTVESDYFMYGIETNASFRLNSPEFGAYLRLCDTVYNSLKTSFPNIPIILSIQDQSFESSKTELQEISRKLLDYSDYIALSTYPFWQYERPRSDADPQLLADDWLAEMRALAPEKPFAIAETGYCAEDMILEEVGVRVGGDEEWQEEYLHKLLHEAHRLNAEFVAWFIYRDYDYLYEEFDEPPFILKIWRDNGLVDGDGEERPGMEVWRDWKQLPVN